MNQIRPKTQIQHALAALAALSLIAIGLFLPVSATQANANDFYTGAYEYGGEAVHLYVEAEQRGPETLNLRRLLNRQHRIDTGDYILLAVVVDNQNVADSGFARLSVGGHKGPDIVTADFQTRLLAPADERRNWKLYLSRDARITGFTAILAPRAYSNYRGSDYGYYDRGYLDNSTFYGWIWRDRYYQHPRGHRFYNYNYRPNDRYFGRGYNRTYDRRFDRRYDRRYNSNRDRRNLRDRRRQDSQQGQRPARPGFGDRNLYDHERNQRTNQDQRVRRNHEYRGDRRNTRDRVNRRNRNPERQAQRAATPRSERARTGQRQQPRQQTRQQPRQQRTQPRQQRQQRSQQSRAQRRPQLNKQRATRSPGQVQQRARR